MPKKKIEGLQQQPNMQILGKLVDFKLDEFVRLGRWKTPPITGIPSPIGVGILAAISTFGEFETEYDRVLRKFANINSILHPPVGGGVITPPVLTEGERKLNQAKDLVEEAKTALDDLNPETALEKLREAKQRIRDADVRRSMKESGIGRTWYDLLDEVTAMIEYVEKLLQ